MKWQVYLLALWMLAATVTLTVTAAEEKTLDLKRGVPADVYLAVYSKRNPERDFQREYWQDIRNTVEQTEIVQRVLKIATSRVPGEQLNEAKAVVEKLKVAIEPIDVDELLNCQEAVYAQKMDEMTSQHLVLLRMTPEAAAHASDGIVNLFRLFEELSQGVVRTKADTDNAAQLTSLVLPPPVPFSPAVAHYGDVLILTSSEDLARTSLNGLLGSGGQSKFDDPRLSAALGKLPTAEDSIVFYDGRQQFEQIRGMLQGIAKREGADNPQAKRWLGVTDKIFDELSVFDHEVTVEYTEENLNRSAAIGRFLPGAEEKLLAKVFGSGRPFEQWQSWVPSEATRYSLSTGANLHALYEFVTSFLEENVPESQGALDRFKAWQDKIDVHIDQDVLQAFSGECVHVSLPAEVPTLLSSEQSFMAMRCQNPDGIRKLLHRIVGELQEVPMIKTQKLRLSESKDLDGFEELSATIFAAFGARPVIGFRDGWMICGSSANVIQKVLETRAGEHPSIETSDGFKEFRLSITGPVQSISYSNMARGTRQFAALLTQAGAIMPMVIGLAGAKVDAEDLKPVQDIIGLLPSVGEIVGKFDFLEAKLSVTQAGDDPGSYVRRSVILVRPHEKPSAGPVGSASRVRGTHGPE